MQLGHSKDHRPDLPQLKIMAAAVEPSGHLLASDLYPGQTADDPLYLPMTRRVRILLGRAGLLYVGDCKMAALATRAELVAEGDYYLMPLPMTGDTQNQFEGWLDQLASGTVKTQELCDDREFLGHAWEFTRVLHAKVAESRSPGKNACNCYVRQHLRNGSRTTWRRVCSVPSRRCAP
jgi:transposase